MTDIVNEIELEPLPEGAHNGKTLLTSPWPFLGAIVTQVTVRVGGAQISVGELLALKQGAVLALDRLVDEPLDVLVAEHVVARGTLVAVGDHFGVRITETATAALAAARAS